MKQVKIVWTQENGDWNYHSICPVCNSKCSVDETDTSMCYKCGEVFEVTG